MLLLRLLPGDAGMPAAAAVVEFGLFGDWEATYCIMCSHFALLGGRNGVADWGRGALPRPAGMLRGETASAEVLGWNSKEWVELPRPASPACMHPKGLACHAFSFDVGVSQAVRRVLACREHFAALCAG